LEPIVGQLLIRRELIELQPVILERVEPLFFILNKIIYYRYGGNSGSDYWLGICGLNIGWLDIGWLCIGRLDIGWLCIGGLNGI